MDWVIKTCAKHRRETNQGNWRPYQKTIPDIPVFKNIISMALFEDVSKTYSFRPYEYLLHNFPCNDYSFLLQQYGFWPFHIRSLALAASSINFFHFSANLSHHFIGFYLMMMACVTARGPFITTGASLFGSATGNHNCH